MFCKTKQEATKQGKQLLARMKGNGWKLHVWQNHGWYYCVYNKNLNVYPSYTGDAFYATMFTKETSTGFPHFKETKTTNIKEIEKFFNVKDKLPKIPTYYNNPNQAAKNKMKDAKKLVKKLNKIVTQIEQNIKGE